MREHHEQGRLALFCTGASLLVQRQRHLLLARLVLFVSVDDALHQMVPHHIALIEVHKRNPIHVAQNIRRFHQPAAPRVGQIDLGDVAGHHALGVESHAGDEHLHLLAGGVLRFVEDDERIVQGAPAHEGDGRDLDHIFLQIAVHLLRFQQIVERVVQRPQIRIDFLLQRARQKSQPLAGFHRRPRQHNAADLFVHQRRNRHGHRQVSFAGARRPNAEDHVGAFDGLQISPLVQAFGLESALAAGTLLAGFSQRAQRGAGVAGDDPQHGAEIAILKAESRAPQMRIICKYLLGARHFGGRAMDLNGIGFQIDGDVQAVFQQMQIFVVRAKQGFDIGAEFDVLLH